MAKALIGTKMNNYYSEHHAVEYILEQFPIVRRKDEKRYGEYRTKRLVLEAWERLVAGESGGNGVG